MRALIIFSLISLTICQQLRIKEEIKYSQDYKLKTNSLYAFNIASAIDYRKTTQSDLTVTTNWGTIEKDKTDFTSILPDDYKTAIILRADTSQSWLNIVGYNKKEKRCVFTIFYSLGTKRTTSHKISRTECDRLRINRYGSENKKIVTYITGGGQLKWYTRQNDLDSTENFKTAYLRHQSIFDFFDKNEFHDVQFIDSVYSDLFIVYQKSKGQKKDSFFLDKVFYLQSNSGFGETSSLSTLSIGETSKYMKLNELGDLDSNWEIEAMNVKSNYQKTDYIDIINWFY